MVLAQGMEEAAVTSSAVASRDFALGRRLGAYLVGPSSDSSLGVASSPSSLVVASAGPLVVASAGPLEGTSAVASAVARRQVERKN